MKGHGQFCPVAVASEVFAQRWTPLIIRELGAGSSTFNDIHRGLPRISRTLLAQRLRTLEAAGVVESLPAPGGRGSAYRLTAAGAEFKPVVDALGAWGQRWTARFDATNLDSDLLMWNLRRRLALDRWPLPHSLLRFDFAPLPPRQRKARSYWLVVEPPQVTLCLKDPGNEVDLLVQSRMDAFARVWLGDIALDEALRSGAIRLSGARVLVRALPGALLLSRFAQVPRPG